MSDTPAPQYYAVCIGINQYTPQSVLWPLRYAEADAIAMDALLGEWGLAPENRCLLVGAQATLMAINTALEEFILKRPDENDVVLFYFAGHSTPLRWEKAKESTVFLASYDFDPQQILYDRAFRQRQALSMTRLRNEFFAGEGARRRLFLFDSCYSGDFFGPAYRDATNPIQGYLREVFHSISTGRVALSSCLPTQPAREQEHLQHGLFTYYLLEALSGRALEARRSDGWVTVNTLFEYLVKSLPLEQRPVLSGVQHDTFELVRYAPLNSSTTSVSGEESQATRQAERLERLHTLLADHRGFLHNRLESFVGRATELAEIEQRIQTLLPTGGYATITGQAGQGKSSIIAKLIERQGTEQTAFHFIPLNPGPEHQVGLLRNLLARLILKYELSDLYVASESRPALRDAFFAALKDISSKGGQEILFIDGLDQLEEESNGIRDLSFLPSNPPPGIILVLGTRPNDTLRPLALLKPHYEYPLPALSRDDFSLILQHRQVVLDAALADRFYAVMEQNALYLDLVAKELRKLGQQAPETVIAHLADNPENLFSLATDRFKRQWQLWKEVVKPVLGVLLAAQEPLSKRQLRQVLHVEADDLNRGIEQLGGLVIRDEQHRYSLYHLKFRDFLVEDPNRPHKHFIFAQDEVEHWHYDLAQWGEGHDLMEIWQECLHDRIEQERRVYARRHMLTHLYHAKQWDRLFVILDAGQFGRAKTQWDPSMRSYALDLISGERAASWKGWTFEQGLANLAIHWYYTLLRCELASRADNYPDQAFEVMVLLRRETQALGIVELLTNPIRKVQALLCIAQMFAQHEGRHQEAEQLMLRARVVVSLIESAAQRDQAMSALASSLAQSLQWQEAKRLIATIQNKREQVQALCVLASSLAEAQQWQEAGLIWQETEKVIATIQHSDKQAKAMSALASSLAQNLQWQEARRLIASIQDKREQVQALCVLASSLAKAQQWQEARLIWQQMEEVIPTIQGYLPRDEALGALVRSLAEAQQWQEARGLISSFQYLRAKALGELASSLTEAQQWQEALEVIATIYDAREQMQALCALASSLAEAQQWQVAEFVWQQMEEVVVTIHDKRGPARALAALASSLAEAQQWQEAEQVIASIRDKKEQVQALGALASSLAEAQQWQEAEEVIASIQDEREQVQALCVLANSLVAAQQWQEAKRIWQETEKVIATIHDKYTQQLALGALASSLAKSHQWQQEGGRMTADIQQSDDPAWVLWKVASSLAETQQWQEAEEVIASMQAGEWKESALCALASSLAEAQQWQEAEQVIASIQDETEQVKAWLRLVRSLAEAQQWQEARRLISSMPIMPNDSWREGALCDLASSLAEAQQWQEAEQVIASIQDSESQAVALRNLAGSLAKQRQWQEAEQVIASIQDIFEQVQALSALANNLAEAQQWQETKRIWQQMERMIADNILQDDWWWSSPNPKPQLTNVLSALAGSLMKSQQWQILLDVTQHFWREAKTRQGALELFPLAFHFFSLDPSLSKKLHQAFTRIEIFLQP